MVFQCLDLQHLMDLKSPKVWDLTGASMRTNPSSVLNLPGEDVMAPLFISENLAVRNPWRSIKHQAFSAAKTEIEELQNFPENWRFPKMVVPLNSKLSILIGCFIINYQFWGSPMETPNYDCFEQASAPWYPGSGVMASKTSRERARGRRQETNI